jgi:hypothetical protein
VAVSLQAAKVKGSTLDHTNHSTRLGCGWVRKGQLTTQFCSVSNPRDSTKEDFIRHDENQFSTVA